MLVFKSEFKETICRLFIQANDVNLFQHIGSMQVDGDELIF
jgi:hypothetical protein